jgi:hypothetical protein
MQQPTSIFADLTVETVMSKGDPNAQNQYLGDLLYHQIVGINSEHAAKITGMMLSLGMEKCISDLKNPMDLYKTVNDALVMLKAAPVSK